MSEVHIDTLFRLAGMAPEVGAALVIAVLAAVVGLARCDVDSHNLLPH